MDFNTLFETDETPRDRAVLESLRESGIPVVLYGAAADVADQIVRKLSCNQIPVAGVVHDEDAPLMTASTVLLKEAETFGPEALDERFPSYNVIIGFVKGYGRSSAIAAKFKHVKQVAYLSEIFDMEAIDLSFVRRNRAFLEDLYENMQDQRSKDSLVAYLLSKTRQDMKYLPPVFDRNQYFPEGVFELSGHESYFDCGAFTGDTVADFLRATGGSYRHIWAVEPDRANYEQLKTFVREEKLARTEIVNRGIYGFAGRLPFQEKGSMLSMISEHADCSIEVDTVDRIAGDRPVTYLKMDVEGVELMALKGAEQTIRRNRPVLGISIYHRERDLVDIPAYIKEIVPEYTFHFRVHKKIAIDAVLYAII
ncbi:MAG: FkbM family methyltransferase [Tannerella sp.]|jgi:FkbM family methyltransferase|nr:FkbM family methyltransferase [Tannerella sp.]